MDEQDGQGPWLEQSAFSEALTSSQARDLHAVARRLWASALQEFLQKASSAEQRSLAQQGAKKRVRFGVYFLESAMPQAGVPEPSKLAAGRRRNHE
jgi:hypothetical protein